MQYIQLNLLGLRMKVFLWSSPGAIEKQMDLPHKGFDSFRQYICATQGQDGLNGHMHECLFAVRCNISYFDIYPDESKHVFVRTCGFHVKV